MKTLRLAVIGTGGMAHGHASQFKNAPGVALAACCDINGKAARAFAETHGIPACYTDFNEMLAREELDAVTIVTSDAAHAPASLAAFKRGLHVLCEKPLATSLAEGRRMLRAARASGRIHMVNFSYQSSPYLLRARDVAAQGVLGRIMHVEASYLQQWLNCDVWGAWREKPGLLWRMSRKSHGGTLVDIGCHILLFTTTLAGPIKRLNCSLKSFDKGVPRNTWKGYTLDADDSFIITAEFTDGALGVIHGTRWASGHSNSLRLRVFGDNGSAEVAIGGPNDDKLSVCVGDFHKKNQLWSPLPPQPTTESNCARFIRAIRAGKTEGPTFEDGYFIQRCLDACARSAESGRWVALRA